MDHGYSIICLTCTGMFTVLILCSQSLMVTRQRRHVEMKRLFFPDFFNLDSIFESDLDVRSNDIIWSRNN